MDSKKPGEVLFLGCQKAKITLGESEHQLVKRSIKLWVT
jgi:hypothetical protein